jgi:hypothetical protein
VDWQRISFTPSLEIVKNPGAGLCFMPIIGEPASRMPGWILDTASIVYFRLDWADIMDDSGNYIFDRLDRELFSTYRAKGIRIAFRIMGANRFVLVRHRDNTILVKWI